MQFTAHALTARLTGWSDGPGPAHRRLSEAIQLAILDGRIPLDARLPSERSLAQALGVSRTTITTAYQRLAEDGFITHRERSRARAALPLSSLDRLAPDITPTTLDLAAAAPAAPSVLMQQAYLDALAYLPRYLTRTGYERGGIPELRAAVAERFTHRGLPTTAEHILITHGAQHALSLITRTLLDSRPRVVLEHPSYPNALDLFRATGARITALPPIRDEASARQWRPSLDGAELVYVMPDFHNPTGTLMPEWARPLLRTSGHLVIDETMVELGLDQHPLPLEAPTATHHPRALTIGSLSKSVWAGLRIGWIRAPRDLIELLSQQRPVSDLGNSVLDQLAAADIITAGHTATTTASLDRAHRCDHLIAALEHALPGSIIDRPAGGLALWVQLPTPLATRLANDAPAHGLTLSAGPRYSPTGAFQRHLRIPYTLPTDQLDEATRRLSCLYHHTTAR